MTQKHGLWVYGCVTAANCNTEYHSIKVETFFVCHCVIFNCVITISATFCSGAWFVWSHSGFIEMRLQNIRQKLQQSFCSRLQLTKASVTEKDKISNCWWNLQGTSLISEHASLGNTHAQLSCTELYTSLHFIICWY